MSTELRHIENHWVETVVPSILEQYRESEKWQALLKSVVDEFQIGEDAVDEFTRLLDFKSEMPTGEQLDWLAGLVNVKRSPGESDNSLFSRFTMMLGKKDAGTPDAVIRSAAQLSGDTAPQYMDEAPATFIVYTGPRQVVPRGEKVLTEGGQEILTEGGESVETEPVPVWEEGGRQLSRSQVRKLAPAGVLGLPGAAIMMSDGRLLCTSDHKKLILAVANDANSEVDTVLIDNGGNLMVTSQQKVVKVSLKGDARYQTTPIHVDGVPGTIDGIRVKDLPDAQNDEGFFIRDSEAGGTVKADKMDQATLDELWDTTEPETDNDNG